MSQQLAHGRGTSNDWILPKSPLHPIPGRGMSVHVMILSNRKEDSLLHVACFCVWGPVARQFFVNSPVSLWSCNLSPLFLFWCEHGHLPSYTVFLGTWKLLSQPLISPFCRLTFFNLSSRASFFSPSVISHCTALPFLNSAEAQDSKGPTAVRGDSEKLHYGLTDKGQLETVNARKFHSTAYYPCKPHHHLQIQQQVVVCRYPFIYA